MSPAKELRKPILAIFFIIIGIGISFIGYRALGKSLEATHWTKADGMVLSSVVDRQWSSGLHSHATFYAKVRYQYTVNGRIYTSEKVSFGEYGSNDPRDAYKVVHRYRPGQKVSVYYEPMDPGSVVLEPGKIGGLFIPLFVGPIFVLFGFLSLSKNGANLIAASIFFLLGLACVIVFSPVSFEDMSFQPGNIIPSFGGVAFMFIGGLIFWNTIFNRESC